MFKKLLRSRSFGTIVGHLACRQVILLVFSKGLNLPSMIGHVSHTFLGCWALIVPALISHFQQDDHPILLDAVAHVEIGTYPFQVAL
jgi:hypothetical protein